MSRLLWPRLLSLLILTARCCPLRKPPSRSKFIIPVWASWLGTHELRVKSTSAVHLHWSCAIHNTMGPNCPSAVSDVIVVCWIFCYCLTNVAHQFFWVLFTNMVKRYRRFWLCTVVVRSRLKHLTILRLQMPETVSISRRVDVLKVNFLEIMNSNNRIMPPVHKNTVTQRGSKALKVLVQAHIINSVDTSLVRKDVLRTEACGEKKSCFGSFADEAKLDYDDNCCDISKYKLLWAVQYIDLGQCVKAAFYFVFTFNSCWMCKEITHFDRVWL